MHETCACISRNFRADVVMSRVFMRLLMKLDGSFKTTIKLTLKDRHSSWCFFCSFIMNLTDIKRLRLVRASSQALTRDNSFELFECLYDLSALIYIQGRCLEQIEMMHGYHVSHERLF